MSSPDCGLNPGPLDCWSIAIPLSYLDYALSPTLSHIFILSIAIYFTFWVLCDVPKIIFEVIGVSLRLTGPRLGACDSENQGATGCDSQLWGILTIC